MKKFLLFLLIIFFYIFIFSEINDTFLENYYTQIYNKIKNKISYIRIIQEGFVKTPMVDCNFVLLCDDYIDSLHVSAYFFDKKTNDTILSDYSIKEKNMFIQYYSAFTSSKKGILKTEPYNVYTGHNFALLLGENCKIKNSTVINMGQNVLIDSFKIGKDYLPYEIFYNNFHYKNFYIKIENYKKYKDYVAIPDTVLIIWQDTLQFYKSYITSFKVIEK